MHARRIIITGATALALVAGGTAAGAAIASGPVSSSGVIDGCYTNAEVNGSHVFVLQDQGTACPKGTTAISWNQTGPAGPAGATGPTGPAGPKGATGPAGAQGLPGPTGPVGPQGLIGNTGPPGPPGTGATVTALTSGSNSNCPNGGAEIADGNTPPDVAYACNGATGPQGPAGPTGPAGPAGGSSLDGLNGAPCNNGQGETLVSYSGTNPDLSVSLSCLLTIPDNTQATAVNLGTINCDAYPNSGSIANASGYNAGGGSSPLPATNAWFEVTTTSSAGDCSGISVQAFGLGGNDFDVLNASGTVLCAVTTSAPCFQTANGTYYFHVYPDPTGSGDTTADTQPFQIQGYTPDTQ
jgi:hypothetical protein